MKSFFFMMVAMILLVAVAPDARTEEAADYTADSKKCFAAKLEQGLDAVVNCFTTATGLTVEQAWTGGFSPGQTALTGDWHNGFTNHLRSMAADGTTPVAVWSLGFTDTTGTPKNNQVIAMGRAKYGAQMANMFFPSAQTMPIQMAGTVANDRSLRLVIFEQPRLKPKIAQMAQVLAQQQEGVIQWQSSIQARLGEIAREKSQSVIAEIGTWLNGKRQWIAGAIGLLCIFFFSKLWAFYSTQSAQKKTTNGVKEIKDVMEEVLSTLHARDEVVAVRAAPAQPVTNSNHTTIEVVVGGKQYSVPLEQQADGWFKTPFKLSTEKSLGGRTPSEAKQNLARFLTQKKGGDDGMEQLAALVTAGTVTEITTKAT